MTTMIAPQPVEPTAAGTIDEMVTVGLDSWGDGGWMNRRWLGVALGRRLPTSYIIHPRYPSRVRDLVSWPRARRVNGVTVWETPGWMHPQFAKSRRCTWLARGMNRRLWTTRRDEGTRALMLWHPSLVDYLDVVDADVTCFYADDFYEGLLRDPANRARLHEQQQRLVERADVVFVTWQGLADKLAPNRPVVLLPHGVDFERYSRAAAGELPRPDDMPTGRPVAGAIGTLNAKIDFDLLDALAERLGDWDIVLIGHAVLDRPEVREAFERMMRRPNVHHLGVKPGEDLPGYVQAFDVCMMCYRRAPWADYILPMKMPEYFAVGKPVVSTWLPSLEMYADAIDLCRTGEQFIDAVAARGHGDDATRRQARIDLAAANTWDHRAATILSELSDALAKRSR